MPATLLVEKKKLKNPPLTIHTLGDRVLRQPAKRIAKVDDEVRLLARQMLQTMYSADGIGLAAPQVGVNKQIIVVDVEPGQAERPPYVLINPQVVKVSQTLCKGEEGCLSIPGVFLDVVRPAEIEVRYKDEQGRPQVLKAKDLLARCILHEMDHLAGVMFVDRVENSLARDQALSKEGFSPKDVKRVAPGE